MDFLNMKVESLEAHKRTMQPRSSRRPQQASCGLPQ
jgi:hypothetical protein